MNVRLYASPNDFGPVARWVYRRDPVRFTVELTSLRTPRWPDGRILLSSFGCGGEVGAAMQMHGSVLLVNGLPPTCAKEAAAALASRPASIGAARGTPATATAFGDAWAEATGVGVVATLEETLYRLGALVPPTGVDGAPRLAGAGDAETVAHWLDAYFVETVGTPSDLAARRTFLRDVGEAGGHLVLWTVDGAPVAMARVHGCLLGMSRIGPVYTPPEHRGHGFGAAVTAEAARHARRRGARDVVLFADDANAVSNGIYRRLGFVPLGRQVQHAFAA